MPAQEDTKNTQPETKNEKDDKKKSSPLLPAIITVAAVLVFAAAGFAAGRFFAGSRAAQPSPPKPDTAAAQQPTANPDTTGNANQGNWYFDVEPVIANLNEPGVTRYIRLVLTLEIDGALDSKQGIEMLQQKNPLVKNWLTLFLSSLSLEDTRGDRNLKRLQSQILDGLNEKLFPDAKPLIKGILFKEFAVQ